MRQSSPSARRSFSAAMTPCSTGRSASPAAGSPPSSTARSMVCNGSRGARAWRPACISTTRPREAGTSRRYRGRRGLVYRPGAASPSSLSELAGLRLAPRQPESGTDSLFRELAARDGLDLGRVDFAEIARTEDDAVEMVVRGEADAAFGLEAVALTYGLEFAPVIGEHFALIVDRRAWFGPQVRAFAEFCASEAFRSRAEAYGGYDVGEFGKVLWNA